MGWSFQQFSVDGKSNTFWLDEMQEMSGAIVEDPCSCGVVLGLIFGCRSATKDLSSNYSRDFEKSKDCYYVEAVKQEACFASTTTTTMGAVRIALKKEKS